VFLYLIQSSLISRRTWLLTVGARALPAATAPSPCLEWTTAPRYACAVPNARFLQSSGDSSFQPLFSRLSVVHAKWLALLSNTLIVLLLIFDLLISDKWSVEKKPPPPPKNDLNYVGWGIDKLYSHTQLHSVGGVAQWSERRSLDGGLSLSCAWFMVDMSPLRRCPLWVGQTGQLSLPSLPGR